MKPAAIWLVFSVFLCGCGFSERVSPTYNTLAESHFNENNSIDSSISLPVDTTTPTMISSGISTPTSKSTNTSSPTLTTTYIPTKTITPTALPKHVYLSPLNHQWQSLNNCHRASIAILMGYYDVWFTQHEFDIAMDSLADFVSVYGLTSRVYNVHYSDVKPSDAVRWLLAEKFL